MFQHRLACLRYKKLTLTTTIYPKQYQDNQTTPSVSLHCTDKKAKAVFSLKHTVCQLLCVVLFSRTCLFSYTIFRTTQINHVLSSKLIERAVADKCCGCGVLFKNKIETTHLLIIIKVFAQFVETFFIKTTPTFQATDSRLSLSSIKSICSNFSIL